MRYFIFYLSIVLFLISSTAWGLEDKSFASYKISDQHEVRIRQVKGDNGISYSDKIQIVESGKIIKKMDITGHAMLNENNSYLALIPCPGVWCSNIVKLFKVPGLTELKTIDIPEGFFVLKMGWKDSQLIIKYGTGLRKDSKVMVVDVK